MPSEVHPESCLVAFFSTHELVFASASLMVPERTAEALAMVRSFMASAPMSAIGAVPCSIEARMAMMASAARPESARSATRKPSTWGFAVRYWLTRSNVMGLSSKSKQRLSCHGCEFAGFVAEYGHELLCGHGFDASVASFEALYSEVEFRFGFFEVGYGFFDGSGFGELVDESFAFDAAFVLADDDAGFGWIVDGLLAVGDHGFAEFVVGVLQVGYDDD